MLLESSVLLGLVLWTEEVWKPLIKLLRFIYCDFGLVSFQLSSLDLEEVLTLLLPSLVQVPHELSITIIDAVGVLLVGAFCLLIAMLLLLGHDPYLLCFGQIRVFRQLELIFFVELFPRLGLFHRRLLIHELLGR